MKIVMGTTTAANPSIKQKMQAAYDEFMVELNKINAPLHDKVAALKPKLSSTMNLEHVGVWTFRFMRNHRQNRDEYIAYLIYGEEGSRQFSNNSSMSKSMASLARSFNAGVKVMKKMMANEISTLEAAMASLK